ncbi:hypothetical protein AGMMS49921_02160 [Endomicrobiia bacterium]|nr:hypothetical protein AGMMS49593_02400 [Endomicrobiia bacterium]GHT40558.1 hypothetical protein AGMMS49921_02160 [Endomicrobiia bacterium]GHT48058.1 hypothetical protein AGMMS49936_10100 [Endomicrobiia bacterium]
MQLTEADILKFQNIYKKNYGRQIEKKEVLEKAVLLINLLKILRGYKC